MTRAGTLIALATVTVLSACSNTRYCTRPQPYATAPSIPPLVGTDNLRIPTSNTALKVPEARGESLSFGYVVTDPAKPGKTKAECLDQPPPIPPSATPAK